MARDCITNSCKYCCTLASIFCWLLIIRKNKASGLVLSLVDSTYIQWANTRYNSDLNAGATYATMEETLPISFITTFHIAIGSVSTRHATSPIIQVINISPVKNNILDKWAFKVRNIGERDVDETYFYSINLLAIGY